MKNKKTKFWISGHDGKCSVDIHLMSEKWREALGTVEEEFGVEYDEESDAYYLPRQKYFKFKRKATKLLGASVQIYAIK